MPLIRIVDFLRKQAQRIGQLLARTELSLVIASSALLVSLAQFYYANLLAKSELGGFISHFSSYPKNIEEHDGKMNFEIRSQIGISLVNSGSRPGALLGLYYAFPPGFGDDCSTMPKFDEEMVGKKNLLDIDASYVAYPIPATTVAPGALSILEANLDVKNVVREKKDVGRGKPVCLVFLALDHQGKLYVTTVFAGTFYVNADTGGYRTSSKLRSLIDLMASRQ